MMEGTYCGFQSSKTSLEMVERMFLARQPKCGYVLQVYELSSGANGLRLLTLCAPNYRLRPSRRREL